MNCNPCCCSKAKESRENDPCSWCLTTRKCPPPQDSKGCCCKSAKKKPKKICCCKKPVSRCCTPKTCCQSRARPQSRKRCKCREEQDEDEDDEEDEEEEEEDNGNPYCPCKSNGGGTRQRLRVTEPWEVSTTSPASSGSVYQTIAKFEDMANQTQGTRRDDAASMTSRGERRGSQAIPANPRRR